MPTKPRKWLRRIGAAFLCLAILLSLAATFGLSSFDEAADRTFIRAADDWQGNPEFRFIAMDYSTKGSNAMRTRLFHLPAKRVVMGLRSLPGLPKEYAVNPTSRQHYDDFSRGPLSAYLHLCSEQDVHDMANVFEAVGQKTGRTRDDLMHVLDGFKMDFPVAKDAGALRSVADLLRDTDAGRDFSIREDIGPRLMAPIREIAADLNIPGDPEQMTADQQRAVFERLDSFVHKQNEELWRTKQLNDFCSGVWAQVYGPPYKTCVVPILWMHDIGEISLITLLALVAIYGLRKRRESAPAVETTQIPA